jgi:hypothetical protein
MNHEQRRSATEFEQLRGESQPSFPREFATFLIENKKWWLVPIVIVTGLISVLVCLSSTGAAPFIYTLF